MATASNNKFQLVGSSKTEYPSSAVTLSCNLSPELSAVDLEIRWFKETECVYLYKNRQVTEGKGYEDRVSLFRDELEKGNVSLQLKNCSWSDLGDYLCQVTDGDTTEELTVMMTTDPRGVPSSPLQRVFTEQGHRSLLRAAPRWALWGASNPFWLEEETPPQRAFPQQEIESSDSGTESSADDDDDLRPRFRMLSPRLLRNDPRLLRGVPRLAELRPRFRMLRPRLAEEFDRSPLQRVFTEQTDRQWTNEERLKMEKSSVLIKHNSLLSEFKNKCSNLEKTQEELKNTKLELEQVMETNQTKLERLEKELQDKNSQIQDMIIRQLQEKDKQLQEKDKQLQEKDKQFQDKDRQLQEKDRQLQEKDRQLQEKDRQLQEKDRQLQEKDKQLQEKLQERTDPDPSVPIRRRNSIDAPPLMSGESSDDQEMEKLQ